MNATQEMSAICDDCVVTDYCVRGLIKSKSFKLQDVTAGDLIDAIKIRFKLAPNLDVYFIFGFSERPQWVLAQPNFFETLLNERPELVFHLDVIQKLKTATELR